MNWYRVRFKTVSGKPDEYVFGNSKQIIREFLFNYYTNSPLYSISKKDIENVLLKNVNKSTEDIKNTLGVNLNPVRAVNLQTGIIWEVRINKNEQNILTSDRIFMKN